MRGCLKGADHATNYTIGIVCKDWIRLLYDEE